MSYFTPKEIVAKLDQYIIGQDAAKKAVAVALRNRYRRSQLEKSIQEEITPKNIIMAGPTGVGKTEIARRLAKLMNAPFVKVEATKFTEVGYVGRDVDSMVRDLVEAGIRIIKEQKIEAVRPMAAANARKRLIELLVHGLKEEATAPINPMAMLGSMFGSGSDKSDPEPTEDEKAKLKTKKQRITRQLDAFELEERVIEIEVEDSPSMSLDIMGGAGAEIQIGNIFDTIMPKKTKRRKVKVSEARRVLEQEEADKFIDMDEIIRDAVSSAEQNGIIFIDEIDKIADRSQGSGPDVSREGVQRDILPLVEGSTVMTKYGAVKTDYILFIAAGAFHVSKISDLIPELQGRFPIKVELEPLGREEFKRILTQPENAIIKQYSVLMAVDNIKLIFTDDAIDAISDIAHRVNEQNENIGARRLHTIIENLLEDISFNAGGDYPETEVKIDAKYIEDKLKEEYKAVNLSKFII